MIDRQETETARRERRPARYAVSEDAADELRRSLAVVAFKRQCWVCRQGFDGEEFSVITAEWRDFMENIADHCSGEADFLLPDTPMMEAVFRVLLARGNEPATAEEISDELSLKWAMTQFQRDTSPLVITRLLDGARHYYCIAAVEG